MLAENDMSVTWQWEKSTLIEHEEGTAKYGKWNESSHLESTYHMVSARPLGITSTTTVQKVKGELTTSTDHKP